MQRVDRLPERNGQDAWQYLGFIDVQADYLDALQRLWLEPDSNARARVAAWYFARPSRAGEYRAVQFYLLYRHVQAEGRTIRRVVLYARRARISRADALEHLARNFPTDAILFALNNYGSDVRDENWRWRRRDLLPDGRSIATTIPLERTIADERTCPALRSALDQVSSAFPEPANVYATTPPTAPEEVLVLIGRGTTFRLQARLNEVGMMRGQQTLQIGSTTIEGGEDMAVGRWITAFERDTADCWRPDDGSEPAAP